MNENFNFLAIFKFWSTKEIEELTQLIDVGESMKFAENDEDLMNSNSSNMFQINFLKIDPHKPDFKEYLRSLQNN